MKLLHVIATPRTYESNTLRIATAFLESLRNAVADLRVETLDLFSDQMPTANEEVTFQTKLTYVDGQAGTVAATVTVTIPAQMTLVPNSVTTTAGTVTSQNPPEVSLPAFGETAVYLPLITR